MIKWNKVPYIRLFLPLLIGIATALALKSSLPFLLLSLLFLFFGICFILFLKTSLFNKNKEWIFGLLLNLFLFLSGYLLTINAASVKENNAFYGNNISETNQYVVKIIEPLTFKQNSTKAVVEVIGSNIKSDFRTTNGKGIIYFQKDSFSNKLNYGDILIINSTFNEVKPPQNPNEFNYKQFLANKQIYYQTYLKTNQWQLLQSNQGNPVITFAAKLRNQFLHIFETNNMVGKEYAVIAAILLGQMDNIDSDLYKDYQDSGALHVLSVSGMHVGVIFIFFNFLFGFLSKHKYSALFKTVVIILVVWFYALMTGLSPPVFRAALMISFISLGRNYMRSINTINIVIASCFFILLFDPFLVMDVGFQLSYLAVIGIILLQKPIASILKPKNIILKTLWETTALSIAAQLCTLPLVLFYFHQFPNFFLLTNIIVLIFSSLVIFTGIAVLLTSFIPIISIFITKLLVLFVWLMNSGLHLIDTLPGAVTHYISFDNIQMILLFFFILFMLCFILLKVKKMLLPSLIIIVLMLAYSSFLSYQKLFQNKIIIYSVNKSTAINLINGNNCLVLADSSLYADKNKYETLFKNNFAQMGIANFTNKIIPNIKNKTEDNIDNFIQFKEKRIVLINNAVLRNYVGQKLKIDYLILSDNAKVKIKDLDNMFEIGEIIFDASNYLSKTKNWEKECQILKITYYNVIEKGAFEANL